MEPKGRNQRCLILIHPQANIPLGIMRSKRLKLSHQLEGQRSSPMDQNHFPETKDRQEIPEMPCCQPHSFELCSRRKNEQQVMNFKLHCLRRARVHETSDRFPCLFLSPPCFSLLFSETGILMFL
ncbi:uncharacterized protein [Montipora capricornis]|uniref:uncharacterized protein n=1 Tax=Montipora capricornis TaxID=246305 RepID=UPI0035F142E1